MRAEVLIVAFEKMALLLAVICAAFSIFLLVASLIEQSLGGLVQVPLLWVFAACAYGISRAIRHLRPKFSDGRVKPVKRWV